MTTEQLKHFHQARPFRAFRLHMADGRHLDVKSPENLALSAGGRTLAIAIGEDCFEVVDLLLVTSLEHLNGKRGLRRGA